uniref:C3H1-type domain-containing protein n=1 Tax=Globodera rostochiensis TaxID=31243 RepID=A0A914GQQ1_GLORO
MPSDRDFSHDDDITNAANGDNKDNTKRKDICRDYLNNICSRGNRCKFFHPEESIEKSQNSADEPYQFCIDFQKNKMAERLKCFKSNTFIFERASLFGAKSNSSESEGRREHSEFANKRSAADGWGRALAFAKSVRQGNEKRFAFADGGVRRFAFAR